MLWSVSEHNVVEWVLCISGNTIDKDRHVQSIILLNLDMLLSKTNIQSAFLLE